MAKRDKFTDERIAQIDKINAKKLARRSAKKRANRKARA